MPRWGKTLPPEELADLEAQLRASLVPVEADAQFVSRFGEQLRTPRPPIVPQARTWNQAWILFGGLSGTLLLLGGLTTLLFLRHKRKEDAP